MNRNSKEKSCQRFTNIITKADMSRVCNHEMEELEGNSMKFSTFSAGMLCDLYHLLKDDRNLCPCENLINKTWTTFIIRGIHTNIFSF